MDVRLEKKDARWIQWECLASRTDVCSAATRKDASDDQFVEAIWPLGPPYSLAFLSRSSEFIDTVDW